MAVGKPKNGWRSKFAVRMAKPGAGTGKTSPGSQEFASGAGSLTSEARQGGGTLGRSPGRRSVIERPLHSKDIVLPYPGGAPWQRTSTLSTTSPAFTPTSKRKRGFPSETRVGRGHRVVHGDKDLVEKLGRNDLCPCGSGRRFQEVLPGVRPLSTAPGGITTFRD